MIIDFLFSTLFLGGTSAIWRKILIDFPSIKTLFDHPLGKVLTCGFCFTFWLALLYALVFDPLRGWVPPTRFELSAATGRILSIFLVWIVLGFAGNFFRFSLVVLQEHAHYQSHMLDSHHSKKKE